MGRAPNPLKSPYRQRQRFQTRSSLARRQNHVFALSPVSHLTVLAIDGKTNHTTASRPIGAVSLRSRHGTRPWSIRVSGTAKVGTITSR
jgi:hypothetical protein